MKTLEEFLASYDDEERSENSEEGSSEEEVE